MNDFLINAAMAGGGVGAVGVGLRLLVGSTKVFIKDVLPLFAKGAPSPSASHPSIHQCKYHDCIEETVDDMRKMGDTLTRIETKLERATEDRSFIIQISDRLHRAEAEIMVLKTKTDKVII